MTKAKNNGKGKRELSEAELEQRRAASKKGGASKKTMTPAAIEQRQNAAALSTGPVTDEGKAASSRNNWKTGEYSALARLDTWERMMLSAVGKPCKSTCVKYNECTLVKDGLTQPGGSCMDKEVFVQAFDAIIATLHSGNLQHVHGMLAGTMAQAVDLVQQLRQHIAEDGALIVQPYFTKEGQPVTDKDGNVMGKRVMNPILPQVTKLLDVLGLNLPEMMMTPKAVAMKKKDDDDRDALGEVFSKLATVAMGTRPARTIDVEAEEADQ